MYEVASAIGTAYEFLGRYASAASWLRTVVARNPLRHDNSEWIHLAYVAAEQSLSSNPRWLDTNTILGYDFGDVIDLRSVVWEEDSERLVNVAKEARLHVIDRMPFVTPPDALFAQLLAEYGDLAFRCGDFEYAVLACRKSLQYMSDSVGVIRLRLKAAETELLESRGPATTLWSWITDTWLNLLLALSVLLAPLVGGMLLARKARDIPPMPAPENTFSDPLVHPTSPANRECCDEGEHRVRYGDR